MKPVSCHTFKRDIFISLVLSLLVAGCAAVQEEPIVGKNIALVKIDFSEYPEFEDDIYFDGLEHSIVQSVAYLRRVPPTKTFRFENDDYPTEHMIRSMEYFLSFVQTRPSKHDLNEFIRSDYLVYKSVGSGDPGRVLFTGYYEPFLQGSLQQSAEYKFPIYSRPDDLTTIDLSLFASQLKGKKIIGRYADNAFVPYYNRKDIEHEEYFKRKAKPLAWVKNKVDLFFLQIQGSGKIYLSNGQFINVHYDISNGRPYRSIGKLLIDRGEIPRDQMSMQRIRVFLKENPEELEGILNYNPSYVFFKKEQEGPIGCIGVKLTPGRSIATDRQIFPLSALSFIETKKPLIDGAGRIHAWTDCKRFAVNQDTGGAIKGPGRADLFWGNGKYAEIAAGYMQHPGTLYFLVKQPVAM